MPLERLESLIGGSSTHYLCSEMGFPLQRGRCGDGEEVFALRGERRGVEVGVDLGSEFCGESV
jgi:hypothetical protein